MPSAASSQTLAFLYTSLPAPPQVSGFISTGRGAPPTHEQTPAAGGAPSQPSAVYTALLTVMAEIYRALTTRWAQCQAYPTSYLHSNLQVGDLLPFYRLGKRGSEVRLAM